MSLVITDLSDRSLSGSGPLAGMIDPRRVAVTGQSDGGDTALAVAYDPVVRDNRVGAAMILSGAEDPFAAPFTMPPDGPPLLAVQGTADTINPPSDTYAFYRQAATPKIPAQAARRRTSAAVHRAGTATRCRRADDDRVP